MRERRWLLGAVWVCCVLFLCGLTIADPDLWGHTLYGLRAIDAGVLTERTDPFSYTAEGAEWVNHEWLSEYLYGWLWTKSVSLGLVQWRNLTVVMLFAVAGLAFRRDQAGVAAGMLLLILNAECLTDFVVFVRPQLATFVLFAVFLYVLRKGRESPGWLVWVLPPLTALWVNLHGGFLAGLGMVALFTGDAVFTAWRSRDPAEARIARSLVLVSFVCGLATLLNPYGMRMHEMLWEHLVTKQAVREWQPVWVTGRSMVSAVPFLIAALALLASRQWKRIDLIVLLVVGWQAAMHLRHVALLSIATLILLPGPLTDALRNVFAQLTNRWQRDSFRRARIAGVAGSCLFLAGLQINGSLEMWRHGLAPWDIAVECRSFVPGMPVSAATFLEEHELDGNLVTDYGWGQFLIWHRFPENPVAFDGRYRTVFPADVEEQFLSLQRSGVDKPARTPILDDYPTHVALVPAGKSVDSYLATRLDFACVYRDDQAAVFVKRLLRFQQFILDREPRPRSAPAVPKWVSFPATPESGTPVASQTNVRDPGSGDIRKRFAVSHSALPGSQTAESMP